ncbi:helicase-related protein [Bradyrhizobium oligotrophicum]|uniref:helicase-related protein n=1 Tax=Bradyrhizobium TaxID=374 RepID=UPI0028E2246A|nr:MULTISPECIES: helicase-related protein [unclassified Bradyrhizobium]
MLVLEKVVAGSKIRGVAGPAVVEVVRVQWIGSDALNLVYRGADGPAEVLLYRDSEPGLELVQASRAFSFDGDGEAFRVASEAQRIRLAHLFDPYLAVHSSRIEPLPHQITAVYGEMLQRQPLRFLLADDPGAGKTIMAGLFIKELIIRADLERCLIIAPGSLVEQWQDELKEKFDLTFDIVSREQIEASVTGNPFIERNHLIMRLDMAARSDALQAKLQAAPEFDLVICDEAHRMAASLFGNEVKYTKRYKLGQLVGGRARHFLLMSATPHNGNDADFQLFMGLLDADRFEGRPREGARKVDVSDLMRRLTKEELRKFDGSPLFPERKASTIQYQLSDLEAQLYAAVTQYVRNEMRNLNNLGDDKRRNNVGFALQILQRRLASSPAAIYRSLHRRRERLEARLAEERIIVRGGRLQKQEQFPSVLDDDEDQDLDEAGGAELEDAEQQIADRATAAQTIPELEAELVVLRELERLADQLRKSGQDAKWRQLGEILDKPPMVDEATGLRRKLLIFTEPRDTLEYLADKIRQRIGKSEAVVVIHGGVPRDVRKANIVAFNDDPEVRVLVANDAAGEGVNLQRGAHLMVNYDLPWNPNRLEQRFGRIHRIGQTEVCHLWNLVSADTREGEVYGRLLEKLERAREALGGRDSVYDVLGELFEGKPLRELLMEAVLYGDDPKHKQKLFTAVDGVVDTEKIETLIRERKLTSEGLDPRTVTEIREKMERAAARRLQPHYIRAFFERAFVRLGGQIRRRETGRYEIARVPGRLRDRDRFAGGVVPIAERYERVCFDKGYRDTHKPQAAIITPGHGLLDVTIAVTLEEAGDVLKRGAILVDEANEDGRGPRVLVTLEHAIRDGRPGRNGQPSIASRRMQFVMLDEHGNAQDAGPAPYLDFRPLQSGEIDAARQLLEADWLRDDIEKKAMHFAIAHLVPEHLRETRERRLAEVDRVEGEVKARLKREINFWDGRAEELALKEQAGKGGRLNSGNARAYAQTLTERLDRRLRQLVEERDIQALPPQVKGAALIVPIGLLRPRTAQPPDGFAEDALARAEVERLAMQAVFAAERALGREPIDVSAAKVGYDIESRDAVTGHLLFIEVKGRIEGGDTITVTTNEMIVALNAEEHFVLAIVPITAEGVANQPIYVRKPFDSAPAQDVCATIFHLDKLMSRGTAPC